MGSVACFGRIVIKVFSEDVGAVKENLEKFGIIYAEDEGRVCFSVLPEIRKEDFHRAKNALLGQGSSTASHR